MNIYLTESGYFPTGLISLSVSVWRMLFFLAATAEQFILFNCELSIQIKQRTKRKAENVRNKVSKVSYSYNISKQNAAILRTKIPMRWMTMNKLSIINGLK